MSGLQLKNVTKRFSAVEVIKGVDLEVNHGEFVVFVGPSGSGKSTLLRMIAGLENTQSGQITIAEREVTHLDSAERGIAMVFQTYALYPHMTVRENMGFGLKMNGFEKDEIDKRITKAAGILELTTMLERKPAQLSGGQRQRVAIGRAIVREPQVFLFDEPLSNLDAELRVAMRVEIAKLHNDLGATMIYVTHDQVEAMTLADKIVVLRDGLVEQVGPPLTLYNDPDNQFVAGFIGSPSMNFLSANVVSVGSGEAVVELVDFGGVQITLALDSEPELGEGYTVGIRPEHFFQLEGESQVQLTVDVAEHLGGTSFIHAASKSGKIVVIEQREQHVRQQVGNTISVAMDPARVLLFDQKELRVR